MLDSFIKTIALLITITGALLTAFQVTPYNIYIGNLGSFLYATWAYRSRDYNIMFVNTALLLIYASGTVYYHYYDAIDEAIEEISVLLSK